MLALAAGDVGDAAEVVRLRPRRVARRPPLALAAIAAGLALQAHGRVLREQFEASSGSADVVPNVGESEPLDHVRHGRVAAAEHQRTVLGHAPLHPRQQIAVKGDLHDVLGPRGVGELGVPRLVGPRQLGQAASTRTRKSA